MRCNQHGYWVLCFGKAFFAPICTPVLVWIPPLLDHDTRISNPCVVPMKLQRSTYENIRLQTDYRLPGIVRVATV